MVSKKEQLNAIKKKGVFKTLKMFNDLCPKCKLLSYRLQRRGMADKAFNKYCDECKAMLEKKWD